MNTERWFEVYEFVDNDLIKGTRTLMDCDTYKEAQSFVFDYCLRHEGKELFIDQWEMNNGIAKRVF